MGGPDVACQFKEMPMLHVFVAYFPPCPLLTFKNAHVYGHYIFQAHAVVTKAHVTLLNIRNAHVALLILRVKGHICQQDALYPFFIMCFHGWERPTVVSWQA